jgi:alpha-tubulin suppressor-like RCC1 family protein
MKRLYVRIAQRSANWVRMAAVTTVCVTALVAASLTSPGPANAAEDELVRNALGETVISTENFEFDAGSWTSWWAPSEVATTTAIINPFNGRGVLRVTPTGSRTASAIGRVLDTSVVGQTYVVRGQLHTGPIDPATRALVYPKVIRYSGGLGSDPASATAMAPVPIQQFDWVPFQVQFVGTGGRVFLGLESTLSNYEGNASPFSLDALTVSSVDAPGPTTIPTPTVPVDPELESNALAKGGQGGCAVRPDRTVACWGDNTVGQTGFPASNDARLPDVVPGLTGVTSVVYSFSRIGHVCALLVNRNVSCWGSNWTGQLGDGTSTGRSTPRAVLSNAIGVTTGEYHTCALLADRTVSCWGDNTYGQLGDGSRTARLSPAVVSGLSGVVAVSAGGYHTCAVRSDRTTWCWGWNGEGQLGDGSTTSSNTPVAVQSLQDVAAISAGGSHNCVVRVNQSVLCWGNGTYGGIGDGTLSVRLRPVVVPGLTARSVSAASASTCAVKIDSTVVCWGYRNGVTGTQFDLEPLSVPNLTDVLAVDGSIYGWCALRSAGEVRCWGATWRNQLGSPQTFGVAETPIPVPGLVALVPAGTTPPSTTGPTTTGPTTTGPTTTGPTTTGPTTTVVGAVLYRENFESGVGGWASWWSPSRISTEAVATSGGAARNALVVRSETSWATTQRVLTSLAAGPRYTVRADITSLVNDQYTIYAKVVLTSSSGGVSSVSAAPLAIARDSAGQWRNLEFSFAGTGGDVQLLIEAAPLSDGTGSFALDNVELSLDPPAGQGTTTTSPTTTIPVATTTVSTTIPSVTTTVPNSGATFEGFESGDAGWQSWWSPSLVRASSVVVRSGAQALLVASSGGVSSAQGPIRRPSNASPNGLWAVTGFVHSPTDAIIYPKVFGPAGEFPQAPVSVQANTWTSFTVTMLSSVVSDATLALESNAGSFSIDDLRTAATT